MTPLDSEIVFYAFRYCLGRRTYAVSTCASYLTARWNELEKHDRDRIVKEINEALAEGRAGDPCDVARWQSVLERAGRDVA